jgi:hypothetical protein
VTAPGIVLFLGHPPLHQRPDTEEAVKLSVGQLQVALTLAAISNPVVAQAVQRKAINDLLLRYQVTFTLKPMAKGGLWANITNQEFSYASK